MAPADVVHSFNIYQPDTQYNSQISLCLSQTVLHTCIIPLSLWGEGLFLFLWDDEPGILPMLCCSTGRCCFLYDPGAEREEKEVEEELKEVMSRI